jgi:hypothetical protein
MKRRPEYFLPIRSTRRWGAYLLAGVLAAGCGHGLAPVGPDSTGIGGTVTFHGEWPPDTELVVVALFPREPSPLDLVFPVAFQTINQQGISRFDYLLQPPPGRYEYLVVAWLREGSSIFNYSAWVELGAWEQPEEPGVPATVLLGEGIFLTLDMTADFSRVPPPAGSQP